MKYRVIVTPDAEADLKTIYRYIRAHGAPIAARRWLAGIKARILTLERNPERTPVAPESLAFGEPVRELFYGTGNRGTYRILYTVKASAVFVFHIRHGSRLPLGSDN